MKRQGCTLLGLAASLVASAPAVAEVTEGQCHVIDVQFQPESRADLAPGKQHPPQVAVWIEDTAGRYIDTLFITQQTGTFGLGNRPGRMDFNSAPEWPYGRRLGVMPVWAHRKTPLEFDLIRFQNNDENNLSHPFNQSSKETHFCRPMMPREADAISCASPNQVFTDKGVRDPSQKSVYPPRQDVLRQPGQDSEDVDSFNDMNPFDAVSQATPAAGALATVSWPIPQTLTMGDYVIWVEVSAEFDHNASYTEAMFPAPTGIPWAEYGMPYRGQPSIVYKVPITVGATESIGNTAAYAGYGDANGASGTVRAPDATISTSVAGSGEGRLALVSDGNGNYRVRVTARPEFDAVKPGSPYQLVAETPNSRTAVVSFTAAGDDARLGRAKAYEIRYRLGSEPITAENFDSPALLSYPGPPAPMDAGTVQSFEIFGLLPETEYTVAIRAIDDCHNTSPVESTTFLTPARGMGEVDACFVATAAYGSTLAADVSMLRRLRDSVLEKSVLGELAVEAYYTFSPPLAGMIGESDVMRQTARAMLLPLVRYVRGFTL